MCDRMSKEEIEAQIALCIELEDHYCEAWWRKFLAEEYPE
jgi:hypothetical protein